MLTMKRDWSKSTGAWKAQNFIHPSFTAIFSSEYLSFMCAKWKTVTALECGVRGTLAEFARCLQIAINGRFRLCYLTTKS